MRLLLGEIKCSVTGWAARITERASERVTEQIKRGEKRRRTAYYAPFRLFSIWRNSAVCWPLYTDSSTETWAMCKAGRAGWRRDGGIHDGWWVREAERKSQWGGGSSGWSHVCVVNNLTINTRGEGFKAVQTYDVYHSLRVCLCGVATSAVSSDSLCLCNLLTSSLLLRDLIWCRSILNHFNVISVNTGCRIGQITCSLISICILTGDFFNLDLISTCFCG